MNWKKNAWVLWICNFFVLGSMSMIMPFLPLFLTELGVREHSSLSIWTGLTFSATFLSAAVMAPLWGSYADKHGQRANLIRASVGMGIINILMFFTVSPVMLLGLRFIYGFFSGFITVSFSYLSKTTPREHLGQSLGFLQTGGVTGGIVGPLIGGVLSDWVGYRTVFAITGAFILMTTLLVVLYLPQDLPEKKESLNHGSFKEVLTNRNLLFLFLSTFFVQTALLSTNSMMTIFVKSIVGDVANLAFLSGLTASITGIANIFGSPILGRMGDRVGQSKLLPVVMLITGLLFLPQLWTHSIYVLYSWRFLQGLVLGGMFPAIQTLIKKRSDDAIQGRAFGINASCQFLGNVAGPLIGGWISGQWSVSYVFVFAGMILIFGSLIAKWKIPLSKNGTEQRTASLP